MEHLIIGPEQYCCDHFTFSCCGDRSQRTEVRTSGRQGLAKIQAPYNLKDCGVIDPSI